MVPAWYTPHPNNASGCLSGLLAMLLLFLLSFLVEG